jgi:hypothetical protein
VVEAVGLGIDRDHVFAQQVARESFEITEAIDDLKVSQPDLTLVYQSCSPRVAGRATAFGSASSAAQQLGFVALSS